VDYVGQRLCKVLTFLGKGISNQLLIKIHPPFGGTHGNWRCLPRNSLFFFSIRNESAVTSAQTGSSQFSKHSNYSFRVWLKKTRLRVNPYRLKQKSAFIHEFNGSGKSPSPRPKKACLGFFVKIRHLRGLTRLVLPRPYYDHCLVFWCFHSRYLLWRQNHEQVCLQTAGFA
jgi:hypothetical protein